MQAEALAKLRLARTEGVGPITYQRLLRDYPSATAALEALPGLAAQAGRTRLTPVSARAAEVEAQATQAMGASFLFWGDAAYPPLLALLPDPPPVLSVHGSVELLGQRAVGMVGGRNASAAGQRVAEALGADLATAGLVVVSGLARGIDTSAHQGALHTGRTIACIAGGLDQPYPEENAALQAKIAAAGAVVTEAPLGTAPQARHFPRRNRIIAGLSLGLVVVEAALRSGSLITARLAQDAGRELFAVPGSPLDPRCLGSNHLIRQGAHLTESAADVLANLPEHPGAEGLGRLPLFGAMRTQPGLAEPPAPPPTPPAELRKIRSELANLLSDAPVEIDAIIRRSQFAPAAIMAALSDLELALVAELLPGMRVVRRPSAS